MYEERTIAAVVPAHNEADHIARVITTMPPLVDHIVIVDDCSTDDTYDRAVAVGDDRVTVIRHEQNTGVGGAIITAHRKALELGADVDVVMAGDGQMDPDYLPALLDPIVHDGYGFTKANRFYSATSFQGMPRNRVFGNVVLSFMTKMSTGYWNLFDPQNGYTATTREVLERLDLDRIKQGYEFENDWLLNLNILGVRARDVPVPAVYGDEVSGMRLGRVVPAIMSLLVKGFWKRITLKYVIEGFHPIALLLFCGLLFLGWGLAFGFVLALWSIGPETASTATVLVAVVPVLMGFQMLLTALQLDIGATPD